MCIDDEVLVKGSQNILTGQVIEFKNTTEKIDNRPAKFAKVWIYEVLKGDLKPVKEIDILIAEPEGKDGSIVLFQNRTYLFFLNRIPGKEEIYQLFSRNYGVEAMCFETTQSLIVTAEYIKKFKQIITKESNQKNKK